MNYGIKINLSKIQNVFKAKIKGTTTSKECICIPIENLFVGEKGVYLNLTAIQLAEPKFKETHFLKVTIEEEAFKAMTKEEQDATPIIGGLMPIIRKETPHEPAPEMQVVSEGDFPF